MSHKDYGVRRLRYWPSLMHTVQISLHSRLAMHQSVYLAYNAMQTRRYSVQFNQTMVAVLNQHRRHNGEENVTLWLPESTVL